MNIWGPINVHFIDGFQYFLTIVDDFSCYTRHFMHNKSETRTHIQISLHIVKLNFHVKLKPSVVIVDLNSS